MRNTSFKRIGSQMKSQGLLSKKKSQRMVRIPNRISDGMLVDNWAILTGLNLSGIFLIAFSPDPAFKRELPTASLYKRV
jgi:hypothetical protein